jgi:nicotinamidase-related amidase
MDTGLLLIDIQNDYFPGGTAELVGSTKAGENARRVLEWAREKGIPIFHVRHTSLRPGATFFLPGTAGAEIHACVRPVLDEGIIEKHFPNSFRETALLDCLRQKQIRRLAVAGMMTHMCVEATVRAAVDLGFECVVLHDACATKDLTFDGLTIAANAVHAAYLAGLAAGYAKVASVGEYISELE